MNARFPGALGVQGYGRCVTAMFRSDGRNISMAWLFFGWTRACVIPARSRRNAVYWPRTVLNRGFISDACDHFHQPDRRDNLPLSAHCHPFGELCRDTHAGFQRVIAVCDNTGLDLKSPKLRASRRLQPASRQPHEPFRQRLFTTSLLARMRRLTLEIEGVLCQNWSRDRCGKRASWLKPFPAKRR